MEQEEQVEERVHRPYKVMEGDKIVVRRKDIIGKNGEPYSFYSTNLQVKVGEKKYAFKKELGFRKGVSLDDGTMIKVVEMFEKARFNPNDKYYPMWGLFINEFEICEEPNYFEEEQNNIDTYQGNNETDDVIVDPFF
jgi:hypothetical protein